MCTVEYHEEILQLTYQEYVEFKPKKHLLRVAFIVNSQKVLNKYNYRDLIVASSISLESVKTNFFLNPEGYQVNLLKK